jgi:CMP-N-acetylneuraminic acid synthetase
MTQSPIFSATEYGFPSSFAFTVNRGGRWTPMYDASPLVTGNTRSQDQQVVYHPNGAIYIREIADLADKNLKTLYMGASPYLMDRTASIDIDNETDFVIASAIAEAGLAG